MHGLTSLTVDEEARSHLPPTYTESFEDDLQSPMAMRGRMSEEKLQMLTQPSVSKGLSRPDNEKKVETAENWLERTNDHQDMPTGASGAIGELSPRTRTTRFLASSEQQAARVARTQSLSVSTDTANKRWPRSEVVQAYHTAPNSSHFDTVVFNAAHESPDGRGIDAVVPDTAHTALDDGKASVVEPSKLPQASGNSSATTINSSDSISNRRRNFEAYFQD